MSELNAHDLVVVDEFGCNLDLTCCYSRAPIGVRACGSLPRNTPANQTVIASLQLSGMGPSMRLSGAPIRQPLQPISSMSWVRRYVPGKPCWSIISALTPRRGLASYLPRVAVGCGFCRPTRPTSRRSSWPSPRSRPSCGASALGRLRRWKRLSLRRCARFLRLMPQPFSDTAAIGFRRQWLKLFALRYRLLGRTTH